MYKLYHFLHLHLSLNLPLSMPLLPPLPFFLLAQPFLSLHSFRSAQMLLLSFSFHPVQPLLSLHSFQLQLLLSPFLPLHPLHIPCYPQVLRSASLLRLTGLPDSVLPLYYVSYISSPILLSLFSYLSIL